MDGSLNALSWEIDGDFYAYIFDTESLPQLLEVLQEQADDPDLNITHEDAGYLAAAARAGVGGEL